jgi:hypothetical protein
MALLVSSDMLLLLVMRLLAQLDHGFASTSVYGDLSGMLVTIPVFVALWWAAYEFFGRQSARSKMRYVEITALSSTASSLLSAYLLSPVIGLRAGSSIFTLGILSFGLLTSSALAGVFILRRMSSGHSYVAPANSAKSYRGRSLLFVRNHRKVALCILKVTSQSPPSSTTIGRGKVLRDQVEDPGASREIGRAHV